MATAVSRTGGGGSAVGLGRHLAIADGTFGLGLTSLLGPDDALHDVEEGSLDDGLQVRQETTIVLLLVKLHNVPNVGLQ